MSLLQKIDKQNLIATICRNLEQDLSAIQSAARETYAAATGEESQAENQYDTRAIEAAYLAGAQAKRALDLESALASFKRLEVRTFDKHSPIAATALAQLEMSGSPEKKSKSILVLYVPLHGGFTVEFDSQTIQIITAQSPVGEATLGLRVGETAFVERNSQVHEYTVVDIK